MKLSATSSTSEPELFPKKASFGTRARASSERRLLRERGRHVVLRRVRDGARVVPERAGDRHEVGERWLGQDLVPPAEAHHHLERHRHEAVGEGVGLEELERDVRDHLADRLQGEGALAGHHGAVGQHVVVVRHVQAVEALLGASAPRSGDRPRSPSRSRRSPVATARDARRCATACGPGGRGPAAGRAACRRPGPPSPGAARPRPRGSSGGWRGGASGRGRARIRASRPAPRCRAAACRPASTGPRAEGPPATPRRAPRHRRLSGRPSRPGASRRRRPAREASGLRAGAGRSAQRAPR